MLWQNIKEILARQLSESVYSLWIEPLRCIRAEGETLELAGPDRFFCSWVVENYLKDIRAALAALGKADVQVRFSAVPAYGERPQLPMPLDRGEQLRLPSMPEHRSSVRTLHPKFTFDEFMVGECNAMAHSACQAIANGEQEVGPCLFINAGTGLGKSHLTHAVAHHIINHAPNTRLHYLTLQQLTAEVVRNIKNSTMEHFKDKYHKHCDVLLMEDVQVLAGRSKTQAELAEALDVLMESGKKIILTGSVAPRDIPNIEEGVRSRLSSGLVTTINPPDFRTRRLIIERKAKNRKLALTEELVEYLAVNVQGDIRLVESAIVGLKAKAGLLKTEPDLGMVKEVVANLVGQQLTLSTGGIRDFVAKQFNVSVADLRSKSRKKAIAFPRQVSMYLARMLTEQALSEIGKAFNRDHSTVVHSIRVITEAIARNGSVRGQIEHLAARLRKHYQ